MMGYLFLEKSHWWKDRIIVATVQYIYRSVYVLSLLAKPEVGMN